MSKAVVAAVRGEFEALVKEPRLVRRIGLVCDRLSAAPGAGFPQAMKTSAETEAFYRLLRNPRLKYSELVDSHSAQTVGRMTPGQTVRVVHDTTEFAYETESEREGLGRRSRTSATQVFFAHVSLVVGLDALPLGVLAAECWGRTSPPRGNRKLSGGELSKLAVRESDRWWRQVETTAERIGDRAQAVHLMDREGDSYRIFSKLIEGDHRFVIRMARDRVVFAEDPQTGAEEELRLSEALHALPTRVTREVPLSRRRASPAPRGAKTHPTRTSRTATLALSAGTIELTRPPYLREEPERLAVNVVYVQEIDCPPDATPVSWVLVTTESIETPADIEAVVDHYRARWIIEEFFKALKTGCSFEERQLESFETLTKALALFFPIAWQMLVVRAVSRSAPDAPAESVLTPTQIKVLQHYQRQKMPLVAPRAIDALYAIAGLGGHLKQNGPPGWQTLAAGMQELMVMTDAWDAGARAATKTSESYDQ
jgi:hypothetical protein